MSENKAPGQAPSSASLPSAVSEAIAELEARAAGDLRVVSRRRLSEAESGRLGVLALQRLRSESAARDVRSAEGVHALWNEIVRDLYARGMPLPAPESGATPPSTLTPVEGSVEDKKPKYPLAAFLRTWLMPTLVTKSFIMFFGLHYAMYPGEGYGWGLAATMAFTVIMFARFLWLNRNETEI